MSLHINNTKCRLYLCTMPCNHSSFTCPPLIGPIFPIFLLKHHKKSQKAPNFSKVLQRYGGSSENAHKSSQMATKFLRNFKLATALLSSIYTGWVLCVVLRPLKLPIIHHVSVLSCLGPVSACSALYCFVLLYSQHCSAYGGHFSALQSLWLCIITCTALYCSLVSLKLVKFCKATL